MTTTAGPIYRSSQVEVQEPVKPGDLDTIGKFTEIRDRSFRIRTIVEAWREQQILDRKLRKTYATWLLIAVSLQMALINLAFFFIGFEKMHVEEWVANTFIIGVFAETSSLVFVVVKYLFPDSSRTILDLLERLSKEGKE